MFEHGVTDVSLYIYIDRNRAVHWWWHHPRRALEISFDCWFRYLKLLTPFGMKMALLEKLEGFSEAIHRRFEDYISRRTSQLILWRLPINGLKDLTFEDTLGYFAVIIRRPDPHFLWALAHCCRCHPRSSPSCGAWICGSYPRLGHTTVVSNLRASSGELRCSIRWHWKDNGGAIS